MTQGADANLIAVITAVTNGAPRVLTTHRGEALPSGPFEQAHRSLQTGLRLWVERQTGRPLGYVEQLYTFADSDRGEADGSRHISISYLGLAREGPQLSAFDADWRDWYDYFPWEDWRSGQPSALPRIIAGLMAWVKSADTRSERESRRRRLCFFYGLDGANWNEELILGRYELLFEAGLIEEARAAGASGPSLEGLSMFGDHRRILATGVGRLRTKIKYRPAIFELMPKHFTLLQLQHSVEALAGRRLHKPNFRRLIEQQQLVEATGQVLSHTGGRPAKIFRFRDSVLAERAVFGAK